MWMDILYVLIGLVIGIVAGFLIAKKVFTKHEPVSCFKKNR